MNRIFKIILPVVALVALSGCAGSGPDGAWTDSDTATAAMMGTAFLNGYNNANAAAAAHAPIMTTCTKAGTMVNCLSN